MMVIYVENLKERAKKLLELISDYNKVAVYKVKSQSFSYMPAINMWNLRLKI